MAVQAPAFYDIGVPGMPVMPEAPTNNVPGVLARAAARLRQVPAGLIRDQNLLSDMVEKRKQALRAQMLYEMDMKEREFAQKEAERKQKIAIEDRKVNLQAQKDFLQAAQPKTVAVPGGTMLPSMRQRREEQQRYDEVMDMPEDPLAPEPEGIMPEQRTTTGAEILDNAVRPYEAQALQEAITREPTLQEAARALLQYQGQIRSPQPGQISSKLLEMGYGEPEESFSGRLEAFAARPDIKAVIARAKQDPVGSKNELVQKAAEAGLYRDPATKTAIDDLLFKDPNLRASMSEAPRRAQRQIQDRLHRYDKETATLKSETIGLRQLNTHLGLASDSNVIQGFDVPDRNLPQWLKSSDGQAFMSNMWAYANETLRNRSGAAVTASEFERVLVELGNPDSRITSASALKQAFRGVTERVRAKYGDAHGRLVGDLKSMDAEYAGGAAMRAYDRRLEEGTVFTPEDLPSTNRETIKQRGESSPVVIDATQPGWKKQVRDRAKKLGWSNEKLKRYLKLKEGAAKKERGE